MNHLKNSLALVALGLGTTALAQSPRTWVSGTGDDTNPCTRTAPCATFAGAYTKTAPSGEIDALDPGSYGVLTITHPLTIDGGAGFALSEVLAPSTGIVVAAGGGDVVILRNLSILGLGTGSTGVSITGAASVRLQRIHVSGFKGDGVNINIASTLSVTMDDSSSDDNGGNGLYATNSVDITAVSITNSHFSGNTNGIYSADGAKITVNDSDAFGNNVGVLSQATGTLSSITLYRCNLAGNAEAGLKAGDGGYPSTVRLSRTTTEYNGVAFESGGNGSVYSYGDNSITGAGIPTATIPLR